MHRYKIDPSKALLGSGGEGKVLEVIKIKEDGTEGGMFVMKQRMCTSIEEANNGLSETLALARFQNEHIVSFEDIFIHVPPDNREMCYVCIVMEHCNNGNLFDNIMNRNSNYAQNNNNNTHSTISNGSDSSNTSSNFNISSSNLLSSSFSGSTLHSSLMLPKTASKDNNDNDDNDNENERDNEECIRITHSPSAPELSFTPSSPSSSRFRPISISNSPVPFRNSPSLSLSSSPSTTPIITSRNSTSIRISNRLSTPLYAIYEAEQSPSSSPPTFTSTFRDSTKLLPKVVLDALSEPTFSSVTDLPPPPPEPEPEPISLSSTPEKSLPSFMTSPSPSLPVRSKSDSSKSKKGKPKTKSDTGDKLGKRLRSPSSLGNMPFYCSPASLSSPALTQSGSSLRASSPTPSLDFYPREQLLDWMYQICNAIYAIHNAKLVHRDLKSENIFISNGRIKIGDFGLAVMHKNEKVKGVAGTYYYSSPELLQDKLYDRAGDIFALGCIFYEMSTLTLLPIQRKCFGSELLKNTFSAAQVMLDFPDGLKDIAELVLKMLNPEPLMRPHIDSILKLPMFASNRRLSSPPAVISPVVEPINLAGGVVRQLIESDRDAFSEIMSRAYFPDPLIRYVLEKNKNNHPLIMAAVFKHMFSTFRSKNYSLWGYFDKTKKLLAACVWVPPDNEARKPTFGEMFQILFNGKTVGLPALRRWRKSLNRVQAVTVDHSWHLLYAAVEPEFQNRGIGKKLVAPVLQWADNEDRFATASMWNDRALHFLEQLGFSVQSVHKDETGKGLPFTYMKRKPNKVDE